MHSDVGAAPGRSLRSRARVVGALFALGCFGVLVGRLAYIQLLGNDLYARRAAGQQLRGIAVNAPRGAIYDAKLRPLALSATSWTIRAVPREMDDADVDRAADALAGILELDREGVYKKLADRKSNDKLLRRQAERPMADAVRDWCAENGVKGILVLEDQRRYYPQGDMAGSILGFVNVDGDGVSGLELKYNSALRGEEGTLLAAKNAWGYPLPDLYETMIAPKAGQSLVLTVDASIQGYLEKYLARAVAEHNVSARAVGIVMEVDTGAILAMSTKPDYDPNHPRLITDETERARIDSLAGEERQKALSLAQQTQWRNKAVSDLYEPGSVFKLVTCSSALDCGAVSRGTVFSCRGSIRVAGTNFRCANGRVHGGQSVADALMHSCNPCFIQIGAAMGKERFCDYFAAYGLRGATGIDLPAEPKKSEYYTADRMGPVELASCSFGQSSKITPIQMITAVSAAVNGGRLMQPHLVSRILNPDGTIAAAVQPVVKRQVLQPATSDVMRELMKYTVDSGPGKNAYVAGYRVGGKSGTSQKLDSGNAAARIASFVGIAPADDPKIAVLVALDEPHTFTSAGGTLAAPVVGNVIRDTLEYLGEEKIYTEAERKTAETTVPDVTGRQRMDASNVLAAAGLNCSTRGGGGKIAAQYPAAGQVLARGSTVVLYTEGEAPGAAVVPALGGLSHEEARRALREAGLNLWANGAAEGAGVCAAGQSAPAGQRLPLGAAVTVEFWDPNVPED